MAIKEVIMKTNTFFAAGMLLPLLLASLYVGEVQAQSLTLRVTPDTKNQDAINNLIAGATGNTYDALSITVDIMNVAGTGGSNYRIASNADVACTLRHIQPDGSTEDLGSCGTPSTSIGDANGAIRRYSNLPVLQGLYEAHVHVTVRNNNANNHLPMSAELTYGWFVHSPTPPPPMVRDAIDGNIWMAAGDDGNCSPVVVPIIAEHQALLSYRVNDGAQVNVTGLPLSDTTDVFPLWRTFHPYRYIDYNLVLAGTELVAGQTLSLSLWHRDHLGRGISAPALWTIECPLDGAAELSKGPPAKTYSPEASFKFSISGSTRTARMFCSIDNAAFELCTSPYTASGLQAGEHVFRVYAGASSQGPRNKSDMVEHRWVVSTPDIHLLRAPSNGPNTTAVFEFETLEGVPATFWCSVDGGTFFECSSPFSIENLVARKYNFEIYATTDVGEGAALLHTWEVLAPEAPGDVDDHSGCSAAGNLPLSLAALAGLWALRRQRS
ncbi:MAG: hypothetical protein FWD46_06245 [Cystobacterineae bacterium]|nr:hypothetical protein [Cystobacterineae bacterium]